MEYALVYQIFTQEIDSPVTDWSPSVSKNQKTKAKHIMRVGDKSLDGFHDFVKAVQIATIQYKTTKWVFIEKINAF